MESAFLAGRVIVGSYFLYNAFNHFAKLEQMAAYAASKGVPAASVGVAMSGLLLAIAGVTLLLGWRPKLGVAALVLFFVPVTFIMHAFWKETDAMARMSQTINFMKNVALLGSGLMFLAIPEPWPLSVSARLRRRHQAPAPA